MTQIENGFYEIIEKAKELEKEGICKVCVCDDSSFEVRYSINWNIQTGEEFVKASALVHKINEWADFADSGSDYLVYGVDNGCMGTMYMIDVYCVWL